MRLDDIAKTRDRYSRESQPLPPGDFSDQVGLGFSLRPRDSWKRGALRAFSRPSLGLQQREIRKKIGCALPFNADLCAIGERFANDTSWAFLLKCLASYRDLEVLVPGCYMAGEDVQFWLRRNVKKLTGVDIYALTSHWSRILPILRRQWPVEVEFRQASLESLPFADGSFDIIVTDSVLEHVRNIDVMVDETARVLRPGRYALHSFGPLYYSCGADHCISAYGLEAGYDHLLLDEAAYRARIEDAAFFQSIGQPDLPFWALHDQFCFALATDYLKAFSRRFHIRWCVAKISPSALAYRDAYPDRWEKLIASGVNEADLLVKGLSVVLEKPAEGVVA
jgi:ubiquinone/menaquinone biosynthesis C-methylase UbiE